MADPVLPHALPELFSGDQPDKPWRDWLCHFEALRSGFELDGRDKTQVPTSSSPWLCRHPPEHSPPDAVDTYDHAIAALGRHFHPAEDRRLVAAQYRTHVQQVDESLAGVTAY